MKKSLLAAISIMLLALIPATSVSAHGFYHPTPVNIYGTVTENGNKVRNARVVIVCGNHTEKTTSNRRGQYDITFPARWCNSTNSMIEVTAAKGSESGMNTGRVRMCDSLRLNVALQGAALPEFGLIEGVIAAILGGGAFFLIRRRNQRATL